MKGRKTFIAGATVPVLAYLLSPMTVFATSDTGSAVRDILVDDRFSGAMSRITWLTEMVDNWFIQIITVTAFFIISMALLKNVLAAGYCAFPKFFDAVDAAHKQMAWTDMSLGGMKEFGNKIKSGKISEVILSLCPNFKAFTDFADQEMSPKTYFMKAIPQMCIMVIMGIFIYNGYYRDVSATVGEAGATIVENLLGSVSPEKAVNDIFNMKSDPKNTYKTDKTIQGKFIYDLSSEIYKQVKNNSTVYKSSANGKENLMRSCEKLAYDMVTGAKNDHLTGWTGENPFQGTDQYDLKLSNVKCNLATTGTGGYCNTDTTDGSRAFRYEFQMSELLNGEVAASEENLIGKIVVVTGNLTPVAKSGESFETTIEAIQGNMSVGAGFSTVQFSTLPASSQMSEGEALVRAADVEALILPEIQTALGDKGELQGITKWIGIQAGGFFTVQEGVRTQVGSVRISYTEYGTDANGNPTQGVTKEAEIGVIYAPQ